MAGIRLDRKTLTSPDPIHTHRMLVTAFEAQGMPNAVFRFVTAGQLPNGSQRIEFDGVCTALQLEDLPEADQTNPNIASFPGTFRDRRVDLLFPSPITLEETWEQIKAEVELLRQDVEVLAGIATDVDVELGEAGEGSSSFGG